MLEVTEVQSRHTMENSQVINALELEAKKTDIIVQKNKDLQRELNNTKKRKGDNTIEINRLTNAIERNSKEIDQNKASYLRQVSAMKSSEMTGGQLKRTMQLLKAEQDSLSRSSDAYTRNLREQSRVQAEVTARSNRTMTAKGFFGDIGKNMPAAVAGAVGGFTVGVASQVLDRVVGGLSRLIDTSAKISDSQADIRKTTDLTTAGIEQLEQQLRGLDTRTKREELRQLAVEAGKLGKTGVDDIASFVQQADKIKVALGEDLGDDAIIQIGKISNAYKVEMLNIGSAINSLGAASEASEPYLVNFAARLAGTAATAKVSAPEVLGYGAVLDSLGLQVEMSSTALSNFFLDFVKESAKFEKAAGMTKGSLKEMIDNEGTNAGFIKFLENMQASSKSSEDFLKKLAAVDIDGSRGASVFLTLANNIEMVKEQQALANIEMEKGTSIIDEFNIKNNTTAAVLEKIGKWWAGFWQNGAISGFVDVIVFSFGKLIGVVSEADVKMREYLDKRKEFEENEDSLNSLMSRHDQLKSKTEKSAEEQEELRSVISKITSIVPQAGSAFDSYGNALDINRGKIKEFIESQKQLLLYNNKEAIQLTEKEINDSSKRLTEINRQLQSGTSPRFSGGAGGGVFVEDKMSSSQMQKLESDRRKLNDDLLALKSRMDGLRGDYLKIDSPNATPSRSGLNRPGITPVETPDKPLMGGTSKEIDADTTKKINELKKQEQQLVELRAEIAVQRDKETASEMQKQLLQLNADWEKKKRQIENQFGEEKKLTSQQTQIINAQKVLAEREYEAEVSEITEKFDKQRFEQIQEQQQIAAKQIIDSRIAELKRALDDARQSGDLEKIQEAMLNLSFANESEALAKADIYYDKLAEKNKDNADALILVAQNREAAITEIQMQAANERFEIVEKTIEDTAKAKEDARVKQEIEDEKADKKRIDAATKIFEAFNDAFIRIADLSAAIAERQMQRIENESTAELSLMENKKNAGILSEQEYQKARVNAEEQAAKKIQEIKRKQAILDKAQAISEAVTQAALGVLKNLGNPLRVAFAVGLGAVNIARIAAQPIPYYSGGFTKDSTHAATLGEHGREYVIPNWMFRDPTVVNTVAMLENKRKVESPYSFSNSTAPVAAPAAVSNTEVPNFSIPSANNSENSTTETKLMNMLLSKLLERLETPLSATWEHDAMTRYNERIEKIQKESMR